MKRQRLKHLRNVIKLVLFLSLGAYYNGQDSKNILILNSGDSLVKLSDSYIYGKSMLEFCNKERLIKRMNEKKINEKKINEKKGITTIKIHYTNACSELIVEEIKNIPEGNYIFFERDEGYKYNKIFIM